MDNIDISTLPLEVRTKLAELDLELSDGDITEKGYAKKKARLLEKFLINKPVEVEPTPVVESGNSVTETIADVCSPKNGPCTARSKGNRRVTRDESRYRSDIREEAVKEVLSRLRDDSWLSDALIPSRRESSRISPNAVASFSETNAHFDSDSAEDEVADENKSGLAFQNSSPYKPIVPPHGTAPKPQTRMSRLETSSHSGRIRTRENPNATDDVYSMPPPDVIGQAEEIMLHKHHQAAVAAAEHHHTLHEEDEVAIEDETDDVPPMMSAISSSSGVDLLNNREAAVPAALHSSSMERFSTQRSDDVNDVVTSDSSMTTPSLLSRRSTPGLDDFGLNGRVSDKIQKLVNTLKRPKKRPLSEYFVDDNEALIIIPTPDPNAPKPRGEIIEAAVAEPLVPPSAIPRDFCSALAHYAAIAGKSVFLTCLDASSKPSLTLTFSKLYQRATRIAYMLLNKLGHRGDASLKPKDRVALVYPNNDPVNFVCAFYGCLLANVVPLPIEVPINKRDGSCQSMGFLLSCTSIRVALTNDQCYKALPRNGSTGDIINFPGWPSNMLWINVDHHHSGVKVPKDWSFKPLTSPDDPMYLEYNYGRDGSVRGVVVTREAAIQHSRALTVACHYSESDTLVCVLDAKRETGLWHAILTSILNGMHVIFIPYSVMKSDPACWLRMISKYKAGIALVKSRDMHWAMLAEKEQSPSLLHSLRMLLVADGANPWSLTTCDGFLTQFRSSGLRAEAICPQAGSSECLTTALRRPPAPVHSPSREMPIFNNNNNNNNSGQNASSRSSANSQSQSRSQSVRNLTSQSSSNDRILSPSNVSSSSPIPTPPSSNNNTRVGGSRGVLSMHNLSYGVVRVEAENALTSLTVQDSGTLLPGATAVTVRPFNQPYLCHTDEVGEICIAAPFTASGFWGLTGLTNSHFRVTPLKENGEVAFPGVDFVRSGLLGFLGPSCVSGGLIFVCGSLDGLITTACRRHNADDIVSTVLAVEPMKLIYRGRTTVFSTNLLKDERVVVVAELRPGFEADVIYKWISKVIHALDSIHQVPVYAVALVVPNSLPKTPLGGINIHETKRLFEQGSLHPCHLLLCPHTAITNLPEARTRVTTSISSDPNHRSSTMNNVSQVGPSAMLVGSLVQGARLAVAEGPPIPTPRATQDANHKHQYVADILQRRAENSPDERLFTVFNHKLIEISSMTCIQLHRRAEKIGSMLLEKAKVGPGAPIIIFFQPGVELVSAVFGCLYVGCVPVPVKPALINLSSPHLVHMSLELLRRISCSCAAACMLTHMPLLKLLKAKEIQRTFPWHSWPLILDVDEPHRKKLHTIYKGLHPEQDIAYLDYSVSSSGMLYGSRYSQAAVYSMCHAQKLQCELYPGREMVLCLDPYSGLSFSLWCLLPVFSGHHALLLPSCDFTVAPASWLALVSQKRVRDVFCSYLAIELATKHLSKEIGSLKSRGISLCDLRSLVIVAEERPRMHSLLSFCKLFSSLGLNPGIVSTSFGCPVNSAIALRGASHPEPTTLYVDKMALRNDRVRLVERGAPNSLGLIECGTLLPGVRIAIAHPETFGHLADSQLGEVCVFSEHNATGFCAVEQPYGTHTRASHLQQPPPQTQRSNSLALSVQRPRGLSSPQAQHSPLIGNNALYNNRNATASTSLERDAQAKFNVHLQSGDTQTPYTRTGYMGFVKRLDFSGNNKETHDALFVVEEVDESLILRGMRYYPIDLENTVMRAHKNVADCAVFTWSSLLVVVIELDGVESDALDVVAMVTARVLEEHFLIVGVAVIVDVSTIPVNNTGKKQRLLLRDIFVSDHLDPIYVAYNM